VPVTRLRHRPAGEAGFTLMELVVAMTVGMIVLLALMNLVDRAMPAHARIEDRVEAQGRGRVALERIAGDLRSAVCITDGTATQALLPPLVSATAMSLVFYRELTDQADVSSAAVTRKPEMLQLRYAAATKTLFLRTWPTWDTTTTPPPSPGTGGTETPLLTGVTPTGADFFTYYAYDDVAVPSAGMTAAQRATIARVRFDFTVAPRRVNGAASSGTRFKDDVTLRLPPQLVAGQASGGPKCEI